MKTKKKNFVSLAWLFYLLIVFEIVYMISPFALYYYSAYGPGLRFFNNWSLTAWLSDFFLPHFSESSSWILNMAHGLGWYVFLSGLVIFLVGAGQIYYAKFRKKGAVTGGLYRLLRHPQYSAFSMMGFGVLLIWPRFIVLVMFVTMLFAYYFLAKKEEKECEEKFGEAFTQYKEKTSMFIPGDSFILKRLPSLPFSGLKRVFAFLFLIISVIGLSVIAASGVRNYSIASLSTSYSKDAAAISTVLMEQAEMEEILDIAFKHPDVQHRLAQAGYGTGKKLLNYIVPLDWVIPDLPLDSLQDSIRGHNQAARFNRDEYKVLFTIAELSGADGVESVQGGRIIRKTLKRVPVIVVKLNRSTGKILGLQTPPAHVLWGDIPTPLF